jgi:hypothetical protein
MRTSLVAVGPLLLALGCGGASSSEPATAPAAPAAPAAGAAATGSGGLTLGAGTIALSIEGGPKVDVVTAADGTVTATVTGDKAGPQTKTARLTAEGELQVAGQAVARVAADGTVSVFEQSQTVVNGQVTKSESHWRSVGKLSADGVFTAERDGRTVSVGADGALNGLPEHLTVKVSGPPAQNRTAVFLVVAFLSGGKQTTEMNGPTGPAATPPAAAPPPAATPPK